MSHTQNKRTRPIELCTHMIQNHLIDARVNMTTEKTITYLVSLSTFANSSASSWLTVGIDTTGALRAGISITSYKGIASVAGWTLADSSVPYLYNTALHIRYQFYGSFCKCKDTKYGRLKTGLYHWTGGSIESPN